jgi:hypothetical protein
VLDDTDEAVGSLIAGRLRAGMDAARQCRSRHRGRLMPASKPRGDEVMEHVCLGGHEKAVRQAGKIDRGLEDRAVALVIYNPLFPFFNNLFPRKRSDIL